MSTFPHPVVIGIVAVVSDRSTSTHERNAQILSATHGHLPANILVEKSVMKTSHENQSSESVTNLGISISAYVNQSGTEYVEE